MPGINWTEVSQAVLDTAKEVIREYHPDLLLAKVGFVFRSESSHSLGKTVVAKASKPDKKLIPFLNDEYDFIIWIAEPYWLSISGDQRKALIDHELSHCQYSESDGAKLVGHDITEFVGVLERWGLWNYDLLRAKSVLARVSAQLPLPGFGTEPHVEAVDPAAIPADAMK